MVNEGLVEWLGLGEVCMRSNRSHIGLRVNGEGPGEGHHARPSWLQGGQEDTTVAVTIHFCIYNQNRIHVMQSQIVYPPREGVPSKQDGEEQHCHCNAMGFAAKHKMSEVKVYLGEKAKAPSSRNDITYSYYVAKKLQCTRFPC